MTPTTSQNGSNVNAGTSGSGGYLEQAVDTYWRSALQLWFLPWKVYETVKGATTLQSTIFTVEQAPSNGSRHRLVLSKPLAPGIPYAKQNEALPASAIQFEPAVLEPGDNSFRLLIDPHAFHRRPGATYWGEVSVTDDVTGNEVQPRVEVWMVVS
jgi:hypothetical protein